MEKQSFMQACQQGARRMETALRMLHDDYCHALLQDGFSMLGDMELARDALQDTLLKAWLACASFRGESELFPWLKKIFRHKLIDTVRRARDEVAWSVTDHDNDVDVDFEAAWSAFRGPVDATPEESLRMQQSAACFRACAERFARDHPLAATVLRWIAEDGYGQDEISKLLKRSPGATREYISQCRKRARIYFAEWYAMTSDRRPRRER